MEGAMRDGDTNLNYGVTSEIVRRGGVLDRWRVESGFVDVSHTYLDIVAYNYMKHLIEAITPLYLCNRPPGAAGALITQQDKVIYGWVGPTALSPSCKIKGCEIEDGHCVRNTHAEVQAILRCAKLGYVTDGTTIYSILKPCYNCSKAIIHAGITNIFYAGAAYNEERTNTILETAGVGSTHIDVGLEYGNA
jgi:dCMP deaminase